MIHRSKLDAFHGMLERKPCSVIRTLLFLLLLFFAARYALSFASNLAASLRSYHYEALHILQFRVAHQHLTSEMELAFDVDNIQNDTILCDRSHHRTDVCYMKGDLRTAGKSRSIFLYSPVSIMKNPREEERIRPYTRKWERSVMETIDEIKLKRADVSTKMPESIHHCDVMHTVPAIIFSTGGYTGNVYHEFNDGLIPLFITSKYLKGEVVFIVAEYHNWWRTKYTEIIKQLSNYPLIDFNQDARTHCFPQITVGLRIHDELTIDPRLMPGGESIHDFQALLRDAYRPRLASSLPAAKAGVKAPKLVVLARQQPRALLNQQEIVDLAKEIGFEVDVLIPTPTTEMVEIYRALNACDAMIGVHGAALTHFLFMRPGSIFIQIVPLGTNWASWTYYGEPALKLGLDYKAYKIRPQESTLSQRYRKGDTVLNNPDSVNKKGWGETKRVYLDTQDVKLSPVRFKKILQQAYSKSLKKLN